MADCSCSARAGALELKAFAEARPGWRFVGVDASAAIAAMSERLPLLAPDAEVKLLKQAGLEGIEGIELFYAAFTFRGWVAYRP